MIFSSVSNWVKEKQLANHKPQNFAFADFEKAFDLTR